MKIHVTHSAGFDYQNELYQPPRSSQLNTTYQFTFPYESNSIPVNTREIIKKSDLILAEVSHPSTGQGIELGWANLLQIPIVCVYKQGIKLSRSLKMVSEVFIEYESSPDLIQKLSQYLSTRNLRSPS